MSAEDKRAYEKAKRAARKSGKAKPTTDRQVTPKKAIALPKTADLPNQNPQTLDEFIANGDAIARPFLDRLNAAGSEQEKLVAAQEFFRGLINSSDLSVQDAFEIVDRVKLPDDWRESYPNLRDNMAAFFMMSNGQGQDTINRVDFVGEDERGAANFGYVKIPPSDRVLMHEMAHHLEFRRITMQEASQEFLASKATGEPQSLRDLTGDQRYRENETAYPGNFMHPYVGKIYSDRTTEVLSMGVESLVDDRSLIDIAQNHPDHFIYTLGALRRPR